MRDDEQTTGVRVALGLYAGYSTEQIATADIIAVQLPSAHRYQISTT